MQDQRQREGGVIFAMLLLLTTEVMFFAGLISAYIVGRANAGAWPPPGQPRLPVEITAANTLLLLISGVIAVLFIRKRETLPVKLVLITGLLGLAFVGIQGFEWIRLVSYGLTTGSSLYGGFFYVIVGAHALHAVGGLLALLAGALWVRTPMYLLGSGVYWVFVVAIWPVLYYLVYIY